MLHDIIRFEIRVDRKALCERLQARQLEAFEEEQQVCVAVGANAADLSLVLRTVEAWAAERSLPRVRYELDGRDYVLRGVPTLAR